MDANRYKPYVADRGFSPMLWRGFDLSALTNDPSRGFHFFDDFHKTSSMAAPGADVTEEWGGYTIHVDGTTTGNAAITQPGIDIETIRAQNAYGIFAVDSAGTAVDNEAVTLYAKGAAALLESSTTLAAFECRVKFSTVANTLSNNFIGLFDADTALTTIIPLTATADTPSDHNYIGFLRPESDGDVIKFVYRANGQTAQTAIASAAVPVADTWIKLGFRVDAMASNTQKITVFVDGAPLTTYVTSANMDAATFPDDVGLCPIFATKAASTSDYGVISMDWWKLAVLY